MAEMGPVKVVAPVVSVSEAPQEAPAAKKHGIASDAAQFKSNKEKKDEVRECVGTSSGKS